MNKSTITKILSANDTGESGGHQAGLLIPRREEFLSFFPRLNPNTLNPRVHLLFDDQAGRQWEFAFIYYNNRFFGGTRNEFRLTRMTKYLQESDLKTGDEVLMHRHVDRSYSISYKRANEPRITRLETGRTILRIGKTWKIIDV